MIPSQKILNTKINLISFEHLLQIVCQTSTGYICFANVHMVIEAYKDPAFRYIVNNSSYTVADGVPILKSLQFLYGIEQERIAGMDFMPLLIEKAALENVPIYFYGSDKDILDLVKNKALKENPGLIIAGMFSPPFRILTQTEQSDIVDKINLSGARIVFVCLGCPKQEKWMSENTSQIKAVLLGVGGAFETYAGTKKMAPEWLRELGLEWTFRLLQEPKRLFKRYLITNSFFLFLMVKTQINLRFSKKAE